MTRRPSARSTAIPDRGETELQRDQLGPFAESEGAEAAQAGLDELKPPRDPAP